MTLANNLQEFRSNLESALAAIPQSEITTDSNTYRLVKLLSWIRLAEKDIGAGGGSPSGGGGSGDASAANQAIANDLLEALDTKAALTNTELDTIATAVANLNTEIASGSLIDYLVATIWPTLDVTRETTENIVSSVNTGNATQDQTLTIAGNILDSLVEGVKLSAPLESSVNDCLPIEVSYELTDTSLPLVQNSSYNLIRRIAFSASEPCKIELFRDGNRLAVFLNVQAVDMQFDDWILHGGGIDVVVTQATGTVDISGYALVNNITIVNDVFSGAN